MPEASDLVHRTIAARVGEPPHPVLLLLHGRGADEADLLGLAPHLDPRFFVVSARAPYSSTRAAASPGTNRSAQDVPTRQPFRPAWPD